MSILGWIIFGIIAGFIASKIVNKQGQGIVIDMVLGVVGAVVVVGDSLSSSSSSSS